MIITRIIDLPDCKVKGMVIKDENGDDNIYINARLSTHQQIAAYLHELFHVKNKDFDKTDVEEIERIAHGKCS